jgi:signal transduction histidine kinase
LFLLQKKIVHLELAEEFLLSAKSEYNILKSELSKDSKGYLADQGVLFSELSAIFEKYYESEDKSIFDINSIPKKIDYLVANLYENESIIWNHEAERFTSLFSAHQSTKVVFASIVILFLIFQLALLFFFHLRNKLLKKINEQNEQLVIQARMSTLGVMSAELAHEINTPLMVIDGRIKKIAEDLDRPTLDIEKLKKNIATTIRNSNRIQSIVKNFKLLSKDGKLDEKEKVEIEKLLEELKEVTSHRIISNNIAFHIETIYNDQHLLYIRKIQVLQILVNLVNNSIDAIKNQDEKWIKILIKKDKNNTIFIVKDSGTGLGAEAAKNLFRPFFTTKHSSEGTGLGLSLSRKIAREHGGDLYYNSNELNTEFKLHLPINN